MLSKDHIDHWAVLVCVSSLSISFYPHTQAADVWSDCFSELPFRSGFRSGPLDHQIGPSSSSSSSYRIVLVVLVYSGKPLLFRSLSSQLRLWNIFFGNRCLHSFFHWFLSFSLSLSIFLYTHNASFSKCVIDLKEDFFPLLLLHVRPHNRSIKAFYLEDPFLRLSLLINSQSIVLTDSSSLSLFSTFRVSVVSFQ